MQQGRQLAANMAQRRALDEHAGQFLFHLRLRTQGSRSSRLRIQAYLIA